MSTPTSRAAAIARLAAIAATMAAVPAIAASIAGPAEAAAPPTIPVGSAALTHLSTLFDQGLGVVPAAHDVQQDTNEPNPFHQFHQGPFKQGGFGQIIPFHEAPPPHNPPPDPFEQLVDP
ncbi:hypothetical protein [Nocardia sp. NPDC004722]